MKTPSEIYVKLFDEIYYTIDQNGIYSDDELIYQVRILIQTLCQNNIELLKLTGCPVEVIETWKEVEKITIKLLSHE